MSAKSGPVATPARAGRPRQAQLDQRVGSAVLELLHDGGPSSVTMEGVAAKSGVAKTSIYRRYRNRGELLTTVLTNAIGVPEVPHDGTVHDKIRFALEQAWHQMGAVLGPGGLAAIVSDQDPQFTELFRGALRPYVDTLVERIEQDSRAGLLREGVDADGVVSLMIGAYLGEIVRRGRVGPDWLDRSMEMLWTVMVQP